MNGRAEAGVLDRLFGHLQRHWFIRMNIEARSLDSTIVEVRPHGTCAPKTTHLEPSAKPAAFGAA
jgi:hypothetical protein